MNQSERMVAGLCDGHRTSAQIASIVGLSPRYVRRIAARYDLPRLKDGARPGSDNHQFVSGRRIDLDGYVLVTAPAGHPNARSRSDRTGGRTIYEHRLVMEKKLGRYLLPHEVVDHIDGLTLHNCPSNLRLFDLNSSHLKETLSGRSKEISASGRQNIAQRYHLPLDYQPVDTYGKRRKRGDVRLRQCLLAALSLGIKSPYLFGTSRLFEKARIDTSSRSKIELALAELNQRWELDLAQ